MNTLYEILAQISLLEFKKRYKLNDEIVERMIQAIETAPNSIMLKGNDSILRYAYTKALSKGAL